MGVTDRLSQCTPSAVSVQGEPLLAHQLIRNRVRDGHALGHGDAIGDFAQNHGERGVQRLADGGEQLGGGLLLTAFDLREVSERDPGLAGDLAKSTSLVLAHQAQNLADLTAQKDVLVLANSGVRSRTAPSRGSRAR